MKIRVNTSKEFHNKTNNAEIRLDRAGNNSNKWAFSFSFYPKEVDLKDLATHITSGYAWTMGSFKGNQRVKNTFVSSQVLALDLDKGNVSVAKALEHPFISQYAFLVHPSASSKESFPKTRVIFVLDEPVENLLAWEAMQRAMIDHFSDLQPDPSCKDASRLFFGSDLAGWELNGAVLPLVEAGSLTATMAWSEMEFAKQPAKKHSDNSFAGKRFADIKKEVEIQLGVAGEKTDQDGFCIKRIKCPIHNHEHDSSDPAFTYKPEISAGFCHKRHESFNLFAIARALGINTDSYSTRRNLKPDARVIPEQNVASLQSIIDRSQANLNVAAEYFANMFNVNQVISRQRMVGALNMEKKIGDYALKFVRYIVPNYFQTALYGAKVRLDIHSARQAWYRFEEENPKLFMQCAAKIEASENDSHYWSEVYAKFFGGAHGYIETDKLYNVGACLQKTNDGKFTPKPSTHLIVVADNNDASVLSLLSAGYCAVGSSLDERSDLKWLFSRAERRIVVAHETQRDLALSVCSKSDIDTFCLLPDTPGTLARFNVLENHLDKYSVYPVVRYGA